MTTSRVSKFEENEPPAFHIVDLDMDGAIAPTHEEGSTVPLLFEALQQDEMFLDPSQECVDEKTDGSSYEDLPQVPPPLATSLIKSRLQSSWMTATQRSRNVPVRFRD